MSRVAFKIDITCKSKTGKIGSALDFLCVPMEQNVANLLLLDTTGFINLDFNDSGPSVTLPDLKIHGSPLSSHIVTKIQSRILKNQSSLKNICLIDTIWKTYLCIFF
jgi:hypothetical protein